MTVLTDFTRSRIDPNISKSHCRKFLKVVSSVLREISEKIISNPVWYDKS